MNVNDCQGELKSHLDTLPARKEDQALGSHRSPVLGFEPTTVRIVTQNPSSGLSPAGEA